MDKLIDLSFSSNYNELLTSWNKGDEANYDLGLDSDELDEQYEALSVAVDDTNQDSENMSVI